MLNRTLLNHTLLYRNLINRTLLNQETAKVEKLDERFKYRGVNKGLYVLLSRTQAGPGRTVKQEQEEISRNHVQTFIFPSVD